MKRIVSYAYSFIDVVLWRGLQDIECGFYIDAGARHPDENSASKGFYENGWRGLHVEPVPLRAARIQKNRLDETVVQAAVCDHEGLISLFEAEDGGLITCNPVLADQYKRQGFPVSETTVPAVTLDRLFEKAGGREVHWLRLSAENMEKKALDGWTKQDVMPWIVVVEGGEDCRGEWESTLLSRGYLRAYFDGLNAFYVSPSHVELAAILNAPPNPHDRYIPASFRHERAVQDIVESHANLEEKLADAEKRLKEAQIAHEISQKSLSCKIGGLEEELSAQLASSTRYIAQTQEILWRSEEKSASLQAELDALRAAQRRRETMAPAVTMRELLAHDDESFVRCAYLTILGREGEPDGIRHYLTHLRRGTSKLRIVRQLRSSAEGKSHACRLPHLDILLWRQRLEEIPGFGSILSLLWPAEGIAGKINRLESKMERLSGIFMDDNAKTHIARPRKQRHGRQFLVDVSGIARHDAGTGIQRVTRSILDRLLASPPEGFTVEPVYTAPEKPGYFYAACGTPSGTGRLQIAMTDDPLDVAEGDIFLGLDYHRETTVRELPYLQALRSKGVPVYFVVHDLLPILHPGFFMGGEDIIHTQWIQALSCMDGVVCVSKTVADDMAAWMDRHGGGRRASFKIGWSHSGADFVNARPSPGIPEGAKDVIAQLAARPSFLMVGTVEPRKGHAQALAAIERLWREKLDVNLVIVGRTGWMVEALVEKLRRHPEAGHRLFWIEGASDAYLDKIYAASACLLAPSEGEGFGLPLIEAAGHGLPLLVRDMPVFREVAGDHAFYFKGTESAVLAEAVKEWLDLHKAGRHPLPQGLPRKSWQDSARRLLEITLDGDWYREWRAPSFIPGNDDAPADIAGHGKTEAAK